MLPAGVTFDGDTCSFAGTYSGSAQATTVYVGAGYNPNTNANGQYYDLSQTELVEGKTYTFVRRDGQGLHPFQLQDSAGSNIGGVLHQDGDTTTVTVGTHLSFHCTTHANMQGSFTITQQASTPATSTCFDPLVGTEKIRVRLIDTSDVTDTAAVAIKCQATDPNVLQETTGRSSTFPAAGTLLAVFHDTGGMIDFDSATMQKQSRAVGTQSSASMQCTSDGIISLGAGGSGRHRRCCALDYTSTSDGAVLYTQTRCASYTVDAVLSAASQALTRAVTPSTGASGAGLSVQLSVACAAERYSVEYRPSGDEEWTLAHTGSVNCASRRSAQADLVTELDGLPYGELVEVRVVGSTMLDRVYGDSVFARTMTWPQTMSSTGDGVTLRVAAAVRTVLETGLVLSLDAASDISFTAQACPPKKACKMSRFIQGDCAAASLGQALVRGGVKMICCVDGCSRSVYTPAASNTQLSTAKKSALSAAWAATTGTPEDQLTMTFRMLNETAVELIVTETSENDDLLASQSKRRKVRSEVNGITKAMDAVDGVGASELLYSVVRQSESYTTSAKTTLANADHLSHAEFRKIMGRALAEHLGVSASDVAITDLSSTPSGTDTLFSFSYFVSALAGIASIAAAATSDSTGATSTFLNGVAVSNLYASTVTAFAPSGIQVVKSAASAGTVEIATPASATPVRETCAYRITDRVLHISGKMRMGCADGVSSSMLNLGQGAGIRLDGVEFVGSSHSGSAVANAIVVESADVTQIALDNVHSGDMDRGSMLAVDTAQVMNEGDILKIANTLQVGNVDSTSSAGPQILTLADTATGSQVTSAAVVTAMQTAAAPAIRREFITENGKKIMSIAKKQGSRSKLTITRSMLDGQNIAEEQATILIRGVPVSQTVSETRFTDSVTGAETVSLLTDVRYFDNPLCASSTVAVQDESVATPLHVESVARSFNGDTASVSGLVGVSKQGSSKECGAEDAAANAIRFSVANDATSIVTFHCNCELSQCSPGSTFTDASGAACVFARSEARGIYPGECGAADSGGAGRKRCTVGGFTYSSNLVAGTTTAFTGTVRNYTPTHPHGAEPLMHN